MKNIDKLTTEDIEKQIYQLKELQRKSVISFEKEVFDRSQIISILDDELIKRKFMH